MLMLLEEAEQSGCNKNPADAIGGVLPGITDGMSPSRLQS